MTAAERFVPEGDAEGQVAWLMKEWEDLSAQLAAATGGT